MSFRQALTWSMVWVSLALAFNLVIFTCLALAIAASLLLGRKRAEQIVHIKPA